MNKTSQKPRIIFLNQMAGPLFRELAEDISKQSLPSVLLTGHPDALKATPIDSLDIIAAPGYIRDSYMTRMSSWVRYFVYVLFRCWSLPNDALMFLVSNPPFLGLIGYLFKRLRRQRYVVLVYDLFPDALIQFGLLKNSGLIARLWRGMNRLVLENAEIVFTISDGMAVTLQKSFDAHKTRPGKVLAIPNWADTDWIRPIAKETNEFAHKYGQVDKLTIMYSGNLGKTHDIETILKAAQKLRKHDNIGFMIIGDGEKKDLVAQTKCRDNLDNLTVLPFQPEKVLPFSLPTADIAVVTVDKGSEYLNVPSKTYYALAAGSALVGLCNDSNEVARIIHHHECGIVVKPGDVDGLADGITALWTDRAKLSRYRINSRRAAENFYSRNNTNQYWKALSASKLW
jgi:glycosyltransferase involved in cell wall biosynthesis